MKAPIFIIGAGRSGTNMLRDILTELPEYITWPCDEINLTFKHGNLNKTEDRFVAQDVNDKARKYIKRTFEKLQKTNEEATIIEKTCANSLRIPFILEIFPEARFIFILRNGFDATFSAMKRWTASVELKYIKKKLPFVPIFDIPYYGVRFIKNRWVQLKSSDKRQAVWGPIYPGMIGEAKEKPLDVVCARQWAECVSTSAIDLKDLPDIRVYSLKYNSFIQNPKDELSELLTWLDSDKKVSKEILERLTVGVRNQERMDPSELFEQENWNEVSKIISPLNNKYGL